MKRAPPQFIYEKGQTLLWTSLKRGFFYGRGGKTAFRGTAQSAPFREYRGGTDPMLDALRALVVYARDNPGIGGDIEHILLKRGFHYDPEIVEGGD
jgi:hypothetical protein